MALSKSTRIMILLGIDSAFFLLELVVGYSVHSLALVADSFHMLNDVLSLCVGLWAVKVANGKTSSKMYTYGWQRAETLGALVNGVFLVALCLSIFLDAIQRFIEPQTVSNPRLVLIVGCFGLLSNILGLFLFHEHGHSHSHGHAETSGHSHEETNGIIAAERGQSHTASVSHHKNAKAIADESGNVVDVLPQNTIAGWPRTASAMNGPLHGKQGNRNQLNMPFSSRDEDDVTAVTSTSPTSDRKSMSNGATKRHQRHTSGSRTRFGSAHDIQIHPASFRHEIIQASRLEGIQSSENSDAENEEVMDEDEGEESESDPLLGQIKSNGSAKLKPKDIPPKPPTSEFSHKDHKHSQPKESDSSSHSHSDLNMRGVFLHVMGDALGNIGVITSALIIWLTSWPFRYYSDPAISLIITLIILTSAIPLCKAASRILLQAVPLGISIDDIKYDIEELDGVISAHHLHVWQLSDVKKVASLHIQVEYDFKGEGSKRYMELARA
ncbi:MAG: hypothetical protein Q9190_004810, partial [Brigantiaea leucoxantha]